MKKICTLFIATVALTLGVNNKVSAQVEQGSILVDLYYGYPNIGRSFWNSLTSEATNVNTHGIGPVGGRFEYMIADNLGVGVDVNFVNSGISYDDTIQTYNSVTSTWESSSYNYKYISSKIRVMARMNYHFVSTDVVDAYVGFGAGYKNKYHSFETTDPNGVDEFDSLLGIFDLGVPVSVRICVGTRFFFTQNIGMNLEFGLGGGPLMSGGLSLKF